MRHGRFARTLLLLAVIVYVLAPGAAWTQAGLLSQKECKGLASGLRDGPATLERLSQLELASVRCGSGNGLLTDRAEIEIALGRLRDAALHLRQELLEPFPSPRAMGMAVQLLPRLPEEVGATLRELGTSVHRPIHVAHPFDRIGWIQAVTCGGVDPSANRLFKPKADRPTLLGVGVECPAGRAHELYFEVDRPPRDEPRPWSVPRIDGPRPEVDEVLRQVRGKYGIDSSDGLRKELLATDASRTHAWLLGFARDLPEAVSVWGRLVTADPDDLEAVFNRARFQAALGDVEGGIATLAHASPDAVRVRDQRGRGLQPSVLFSLQCALRFRERKLPEARALCDQGLGRGSKAASNAFLARIALLEGDLTAADGFSAAAAAAGGPAEWTLRALVLRLKGGPESEISALVQRVLDHDRPTPTHVARLVRDGARRSARQWIDEEEREEMDAWAADLASCGHLYLDLDVPDRADRCLRASERLAPEFARAARALHLSETDPKRARTEVEHALASSRHQSLVSAMGIVEQRLGNDRAALDWLEQALAMNERDWRAGAAVRAACERIGEADCEQRSSGRSRSLKITR